MPPGQRSVYRFGEFAVDPHARTLTYKGAAVSLSRRSFDLLLYFVQNSGKILGKDELLKNIWPDIFVDENSLAKSISVLRKALSDSCGDSTLVVTLPGRGYQFAAPIEIAGPLAATPDAELAAGAEASALGLLRQRRTIRTSIVEVRQDRFRMTPLGWMVAAALAFLVSAAIGGGGFLLWRHFHASPHFASVVLADFANTTGDKDFDYALNRAFQIELEQSPFLQILPHGAVKDTLAQMKLKPDEPLTPELAREVCERNNAQAVIGSSISKIADSYLLIVDATSCVSGDSLAGYKAQVSSKRDVLPALDAAAGRVRTQLGESAASLDKFQTPIAQATTSSLEALRAYTQAIEASDRGDTQATQVLFQKAIALDANFASAWKGLAVNEYNRGDFLKATSLIQKAFDLSAHTTERERLTIAIAYNAFGTYDYEATIASMRLYNQMYPNSASNWANLANMYTQLGEYPQAIEAGEQAIRATPHSAIAAEILARAYKRDNRLSDAKRVAEEAVKAGKDDWGTHSILFQIAVAERDTAHMKSEGEWGFAHQEIRRSLTDLAFAAATEGKLRESIDDFSRAQLEAARRGDTDFVDSILLDMAEVQFDLGSSATAAANLRQMQGDAGDPGALAFIKAELGDQAPAQHLIAEISRSGVKDTVSMYYDLPMLRALMALKAHHPAEAIHELEPARIYQMRDFKVPTFRARAEVEAGMFDRAAEDYRLILANQGVDPTSPLYSLAHLRLARVLVLESKPDQARAEYEALFTAWKDADPQLPLLVQAKEEYARLKSH